MNRAPAATDAKGLARIVLDILTNGFWPSAARIKVSRLKSTPYQSNMQIARVRLS